MGFGDKWVRGEIILEDLPEPVSKQCEVEKNRGLPRIQEAQSSSMGTGTEEPGEVEAGTGVFPFAAA